MNGLQFTLTKNILRGLADGFLGTLGSTSAISGGEATTYRQYPKIKVTILD